jgi:hypothetical protein
MLNRFSNSALAVIVGMIVVVMILIGCMFKFVGFIHTATTHTAPLVTGEYTSSKFIVERFKGISISLVTDKLTGCEYVYTQSGGITPRMYSDGIQVCGPNTYPNGDHSTE